jgi:glycosyltransferase involved in cell wall biosynthesis
VSRAAKNSSDTKPFIHMKNSYLLDNVNPGSIASAIGYLEETPSDVKKIIDGAEELKEYFSWDHIVKEHFKLYEES